MTANLKKISVLALILSSSSAIAGSMGPMVEALTLNPKEGVYFGVGVGASINDYKFTAINMRTNNSVKVSSNNTNALANVFLGYGHTFVNDLYLGGEANIYSPRKVTFNNRPGVVDLGVLFNDKYTVTDYLALDLLPGYRVNSNLLAYGRVGMAFRNANFNQQAVSLLIPGVSDSTSSVGGRFGVGATYALNNHFAASVDYFYSYTPTFGTYSPVFAEQFNFKSSSNYIGASLVYTI